VRHLFSKMQEFPSCTAVFQTEAPWTKIRMLGTFLNTSEILEKISQK